jgi:hypothetical protein
MPDSTRRAKALSRRAFLKKAAATTAAGFASAPMMLDAQVQQRPLSIALLPAQDDPIVKLAPAQWALEELRLAFNARSIAVRTIQTPDDAAGVDAFIVATGKGSRTAREVLLSAGIMTPDVPEALALVPGRLAKRRVRMVWGSDLRGLVYGLLELADRVRLSPDVMADLHGMKVKMQRPSNQIRGIARIFASDVEDKGWFNDRVFWTRYLTELASQRFNRFHLALGLGYDFTNGIDDAYFHFSYPFFVSVPGYNVRAKPLPDDERDRNLETLRFISEETVRRGMHFQLGVWTHAYEWTDSPKANYVIEGLRKDNHAAYCQEALSILLKECPAIGGVTFRIHGESGVAEGSYDFWKAVFEGVTHCGRRVEIDLHAKGIDDRMIETALATGMPVTVAPKFWAEHMGLGYMQGAIRPQEMPPRENRDSGFFARSSGSRRFLRYGYGDLLTENRRYGVLHRIWPGTQRLLLLGNPDLAASYGQVSSFCGSLGVEWFEPLSFKGRKGSGLPGGRNGYEDISFLPAAGDFEKFSYSYRLWGRHVYDHKCDPEECRRWLWKQYGNAASPMESAMREAGFILPLITTAHCPAAANNNYWPEMYTNMPIVDPKRPHPYGESLSPKRFGAVSSLDPEFFSRIDDFAGQLINGELNAKYSPAYVASALEAHAARAKGFLTDAKAKISNPRNPEYRRASTDILIQCGLGNFFAWKFRAGILFALFGQTQYQPALEEALKAYRKARAVWASFAETARPVYRRDVTFGPEYFQRGHWLDRLPAIDADITDMERLLDNEATSKSSHTPELDHAMARHIDEVLHASGQLLPNADRGFHIPDRSFQRGQELRIRVLIPKARRARTLVSVILRYRRVNQVETWNSTTMEIQGPSGRASIPADYTNSVFPLQYYFELRDLSGVAGLYPGLTPGWDGQPYFVLRQG